MSDIMMRTGPQSKHEHGVGTVSKIEAKSVCTSELKNHPHHSLLVNLEDPSLSIHVQLVHFRIKRSIDGQL